MTDRSTVELTLHREEALALFEFLAREIDDAYAGRLKPLCRHDGELWALSGLQAKLERMLPEPFATDYAVRLAAALDGLVARSGSWPA